MEVDGRETGLAGMGWAWEEWEKSGKGRRIRIKMGEEEGAREKAEEWGVVSLEADQKGLEMIARSKKRRKDIWMQHY